VQASVVAEINASPLPTKRNLVFRKRAVARKIRRAAREKDGSPEGSFVVPLPPAKNCRSGLAGFQFKQLQVTGFQFSNHKFPARFRN
jgi:hypothetical protein